MKELKRVSASFPFAALSCVVSARAKSCADQRTRRSNCFHLPEGNIGQRKTSGKHFLQSGNHDASLQNITQTPTHHDHANTLCH